MKKTRIARFKRETFSLICVLFVSCGLESFVYLEPVQNVSISTVTSVNFVLPSQSAPGFRHYTIFYRIYLTDTYVPSFASDIQRDAVNTNLTQHFSTLNRYTSDDNVSPGAIDTVFRNLKYYSLFASRDGLSEEPLYSILTPSAGPEIRLDFSTPQSPVLRDITAGTSYFLFRANNFNPYPNRIFNYTDDLATGVISNEVNADLQQKTGYESTQYAYVSMYILAVGIDDYYSPIYSRPTYIGTFNLPKQNFQ